MEGFFLGLANGTVCLAYCLPVLGPYWLGKGNDIRGNYRDLVFFMSGRLTGYLIFAVFAWLFNLWLPPTAGIREIIFGFSYLVMAILLVWYGWKGHKSFCAANTAMNPLTKWGHVGQGNRPFRNLLPLWFGLLTGLNLCPPFLLAFTGAAAAGSLGKSLLFFLFFFAGTTVFFLPFPLVGAFGRRENLRLVGRMAAGVVGCYYFYLGVLLFVGGIVKS